MYALYDLCDYPEYLEPLRREKEVQGHAWSGSLDQMPLLDSFLKESARLNPSDSGTKPLRRLLETINDRVSG